MHTFFKRSYKIAIFIVLLNSCIGQTNHPKIDSKQAVPFSILGKWKLIKRISQDESNPLSQKESLECSGDITIFNRDSFISPNDKCFGGYKCLSPNYKLKKVNALDYFENDESFLKLLGIKSEIIEVITSDCGVPFNSIIILDENHICYGIDGYEYFFKRVIAPKATILIERNPVLGDTVKCSVSEKNACSGYVIQGTRKKGKAVHVKPTNKNVPLEIR